MTWQLQCEIKLRILSQTCEVWEWVSNLTSYFYGRNYFSMLGFKLNYNRLYQHWRSVPNSRRCFALCTNLDASTTNKRRNYWWLLVKKIGIKPLKPYNLIKDHCNSRYDRNLTMWSLFRNSKLAMKLATPHPPPHSRIGSLQRRYFQGPILYIEESQKYATLSRSAFGRSC